MNTSVIAGCGNMPVIFLMGPTASGKTDIAARLTDQFPVDLISVDAAQVYRTMNIGTAKPELSFLQRFPHQLIDIRDPENSYSAADFVRDAGQAILDSHSHGKIPVLVGGTLFYFNALERGLSELPAANAQVRRRIESEFDKSGVRKMHEKLESIDSHSAQRIDPNDRQRIQRAMEIFHITGRPPSLAMRERQGLNYPLIKLTLFTPDRSLLHRQIAKRFENMLEQGLIEEVQDILSKNPDIVTAASMRTVGYRQVIAYLQDQVNYEQMIDNSVAATRQLAKRQLTWLRQQSGVTWFEAGGDQTLSSICTYLEHSPQLVEHFAVYRHSV